MAEFLTYKGKPLVRQGNEIYYGNMTDKYVVKLEILSDKKVGNNTLPDKIKVILMNSDITLDEKAGTIKTSEKNGIYEAMDIASVWLERQLQKEQ